MNPPIVKLNYTSGSWVDLWQVESSSKPGTYHIVGRTAAGDFGCDCPRWTKNANRPMCRHISAVKTLLAERVLIPVTQVKAEAQPEQVRKALSRFALLE